MVMMRMMMMTTMVLKMIVSSIIIRIIIIISIIIISFTIMSRSARLPERLIEGPRTCPWRSTQRAKRPLPK